MDISDVIQTKLNYARRVLQELIDHYGRLDDTERMAKSNIFLDELNSYLQIKENMIFPLMQRSGEYDDLVARACAVHSEIDELKNERLVMIHVDEPDCSYYDILIRLAGLLEQSDKVDREAIYPWMRVYLSDEEKEYIMTHLKNQMVHESFPSSGMAPY